MPITPNLAMLRIKGWQVYVWRDDDSVTLIDTGAPGSSAEILCAVPGVDRIVLTHGHVDHCGSAAELHQATGAPVLAGAGDAAAIRTGAAVPPPVFEDWEVPIYQRVSVGLPDVARPVPVDRELVDGDVLAFGGGAEILAIPGHTEGSIAIHLTPRHAVHRGHHRQCRHRHAGHLQPGPGTNCHVVSAVGRARRRDSLLRPWRADRLRCR